MKTIETSKIKTLEKRIGKNVCSDAPLISVIIPAYNCAEFIADTLDSVLLQTSTDYEIILVNDGSPDTEKFEKILTPYFENLIYIKQENGGTAAARNTAIKSARGKWLAFLDSDDIWLSQYLSRQMQEIEMRKLDLIYADALFFGDVTDHHKTFMQKSPSHGDVTAKKMLSSECHIITSGTMVRRDKVLEAGLFDEDLPRIGMEDFDLWFRLVQSGLRVGYQKQILLKYRVRSNSLSGSKIQRAEREISGLDIIRRKYDLTDSECAAAERHYKEAIAELSVEKGKFNLTQGNYAEARGNFREANKYYRKFKYRIFQMLLTINPKLAIRIFKKLRPKEFSFIEPESGGNF